MPSARGVVFIFSIGAVGNSIANFIDRDAPSRPWARPFSRVARMMTLITFTFVFITSILAVVISITDPVLVDALAIGASELMASAGVIGAVVLIAVILTVIVVVTDVGAEDALPTATFKLLV